MDFLIYVKLPQGLPLIKFYGWEYSKGFKYIDWRFVEDVYDEKAFKDSQVVATDLFPETKLINE